MNNKISEGEPPSPVREKATSGKGAFESPSTADDHPPFSLHLIKSTEKIGVFQKRSSLFLFRRFSSVVKRPHLIYAAINRHKEFQFIITTFANTL